MLNRSLQAVATDRQSARKTTGGRGFRPVVIGTDHPLRKAAEAFIAEGFETSYGACIYHYMPHLVALKTDGIKACLGVRPAAAEPLFIERYLDQPIEQAIPGLGIAREYIVEIGNLVSHNRHATLLLFMMTAVSLHRAGFRELVFCATHKVAGILKQTGAPLQAIVEADGRRLGASLPEWGRYYDTHPVVMHLNLSAIVSVIERSPLLRRLSAGYELAVDGLVPYACVSRELEQI